MIEGNKAEAQKRLEFGENLPPKRGRANENWSERPVWSSNEGSLTRESVREALSMCARARARSKKAAARCPREELIKGQCRPSLRCRLS